ncbi:aluminum resistance family protein [Thalassoporum mexicanum PCC 7367]|uniref:methionine gamma-lyase family protein n=1 Tax=Thalassoporum mexicanum TaxID=3457544 RepID=UPI00029FD38D|nr:aminotransferase class I/II-fold pyridoxal phosphate-dependent enzyme [Pseudanabaena sp. PCC 7367]AFY70780.1 aluminum resistance family protein [Pseudanabaena sp. PCC 7367]
MKELVAAAIAKLASTFAAIDLQTKHNLEWVLAAFREHKLGAHHFASVSGYGHDDAGRELLDKVWAQIFGAEAAIVRVQLVSGTHAIACCLFGILRPGDELLSVAGAPYDTLAQVIGQNGAKQDSGQGSLCDFGISYRQVDLTATGEIDWQALATAIRPETRMVLIQRSCGYDWRASLSIEAIARIIEIVKQQNPHTICFVDNCYGEFIAEQEPTAVGADLVAGSLIKNPGGTIATTGGYIAGKAEYVEMAACRLTAPGIGTSGGATLDQTRLMFQGLFLAPQMVGEAIKGNHLAAYVFDRLGYAVNPLPFAPRRDLIQAIKLGSPEKLIAFCRSIQKYSPVDSYVDPVPGHMPGYESQLVMAGGTFIDGSTSELSADGPLRSPYVVYLQGGTHWSHVAIALENLVL